MCCEKKIMTATLETEHEISKSIARELLMVTADAIVDRVTIGDYDDEWDDYDPRTTVYLIGVNGDDFIVYVDDMNREYAYDASPGMFEDEVANRASEREYIPERAPTTVTYDPAADSEFDFAGLFDGDEWDYERIDD